MALELGFKTFQNSPEWAPVVQEMHSRGLGHPLSWRDLGMYRSLWRTFARWRAWKRPS